MSWKLQDASLTEKHELWIAKHGRIYKDPAEEEKHFNIFKDNVEYIESMNSAWNWPYKLSINEFSDQTNKEFKASRNRCKSLHEPRLM